MRQSLGGDATLVRLRERPCRRGLKLLLDFVSNHTGLDQPWVESRPEYSVPGTEADLTRAPHNYARVTTGKRELVLAPGATRTSPAGPTRCH